MLREDDDTFSPAGQVQMHKQLEDFKKSLKLATYTKLLVVV